MKALSLIALSGFLLLGLQTAETPKQRAERREKECKKFLDERTFKYREVTGDEKCLGKQRCYYLPGDTTYSMLFTVANKKGYSNTINELNNNPLQIKVFTYLENNKPVYVVCEKYKLNMSSMGKIKYDKIGRDYFVFDDGNVVEYGNGSEVITDERLKENKSCVEIVECTNARVKALPELTKK
jgi:hypothetical protein